VGEGKLTRVKCILVAKIDDENVLLCPVCGSTIQWRCVSNVGWAMCNRSPSATRSFRIGIKLKFCDWEATCIRRDNGGIDIVWYRYVVDN
jgi:hypothetical protein